MRKTEEDFESRIFFEAQKDYFGFELRFIFFPNGHIHNVISTLPNVVKIDVENDNVVSTLSSVVQFNVEIHNVVERCKFQLWRTQCCFNIDLTLCDVATSYQPKYNVEPTLKCTLGKVILWTALKRLEETSQWPTKRCGYFFKTFNS